MLMVWLNGEQEGVTTYSENNKSCVIIERVERKMVIIKVGIIYIYICGVFIAT